MVRRREPVGSVASARGEDPDAVRLRVVVVLRRLSDLPPGQRLTAGVADYITEDRSVVVHTRNGRLLSEAGTDPILLDTLYQTALTVRAVSRRRWALDAERNTAART